MTVLKELINKWEDEYYNGDSDDESYMKFIKDAKEVLEKDKQQLIHAFNMGSIDEIRAAFKHGSEFYKEIYE